MPPKLSTKVSKIPSDCPLAAMDSQTKLNQKHSSRVGVPGRLQDCKIARGLFSHSSGRPPGRLQDCKIAGGLFSHSCGCPPEDRNIARFPEDTFLILGVVAGRVAPGSDTRKNGKRVPWKSCNIAIFRATPWGVGQESLKHLNILQYSGRRPEDWEKSPREILQSCNLPGGTRKRQGQGQGCRQKTIGRKRCAVVAKRSFVPT